MSKTSTMPIREIFGEVKVNRQRCVLAFWNIHGWEHWGSWIFHHLWSCQFNWWPWGHHGYVSWMVCFLFHWTILDSLLLKNKSCPKEEHIGHAPFGFVPFLVILCCQWLYQWNWINGIGSRKWNLSSIGDHLQNGTNICGYELSNRSWILFHELVTWNSWMQQRQRW